MVHWSISASPLVVDGAAKLSSHALRARLCEAHAAWLARSPSPQTRSAYARDVQQFLQFLGVKPDALEVLVAVRPADVAAFRDALTARGLCNASILRKITALRSLFSYL